jgi:hypothetical protein
LLENGLLLSNNIEVTNVWLFNDAPLNDETVNGNFYGLLIVNGLFMTETSVGVSIGPSNVALTCKLIYSYPILNF